MDNLPKTVTDLFPSEYLKNEDLQGKAWTVTVSAVEVREMRSNFSSEKEWKAVLHFEKGKKVLVLNKTNALAMARIARDETLTAWVGLSIVLVPAVYRNKETIQIRECN